MALIDMDSQYQECSWEWVGGPLIWKCFFHTCGEDGYKQFSSSWYLLICFSLTLPWIINYNYQMMKFALSFHFGCFFLFCWQSYKKTVALQSHVKVDLIWTFCGKTSKKVTSTETVDIFWSDAELVFVFVFASVNSSKYRKSRVLRWEWR